ncbi:MAG: M20/M25/M40 family metallo-hydrolase [Archaeoglobaceae archaeon]
MLLKKLVEIQSVSGHEKELKNFVRDFLEEHGYEIFEHELFIVANPKSDLIVATHLDTVSIKSEFRTDGIKAYGTGVADAKASISAMLQAASKGVDFTLAFFCDEEVNGSGSKAFIELWNRGKFAVVMEPTSLKIAKKHLGCIEADLTFKGYPCHASMPESGVNAIHRALNAYQKLSEKFRVSILKIDGGSWEYVIPEHCFMRLDFLLEPGELNEALEELKKVDAELKILESAEGFYSGKVVELLAKAMELSGLKPEFSVMPSWTDAINLAKKFDVVVWGPGELKDCHTNREFVDLIEIELAKNVLLKLNEIYKSL